MRCLPLSSPPMELICKPTWPYRLFYLALCLGSFYYFGSLLVMWAIVLAEGFRMSMGAGWLLVGVFVLAFLLFVTLIGIPVGLPMLRRIRVLAKDKVCIAVLGLLLVCGRPAGVRKPVYAGRGWFYMRPEDGPITAQRRLVFFLFGIRTDTETGLVSVLLDAHSKRDIEKLKSLFGDYSPPTG